MKEHFTCIISIAFVNVLTFIKGCRFWRNFGDNGDSWPSCCWALSRVCWLAAVVEPLVNCEFAFFNGEIELAERFVVGRRAWPCCCCCLDNELSVLLNHEFSDGCVCWPAGWFSSAWLFVDQAFVWPAVAVGQFDVVFGNEDVACLKSAAVVVCCCCCCGDVWDLLTVIGLLKLCAPVIARLDCESGPLSGTLVPLFVWLRNEIWLLSRSSLVDDGTNELPSPFTSWFKLCCKIKFDWLVALSNLLFVSSYEMTLLFRSVIDAPEYLSI